MASKKEAPDQEYVIERIVKDRVNRGVRQYFVKWEGYPMSENTWQSEEDLGNASELIREYNEKKKQPKHGRGAAGSGSSDAASASSGAGSAAAGAGVSSIVGATLVNGKLEITLQTAAGDQVKVGKADVTPALLVDFMAHLLH
jgi:hypothetical protein